MRRLVTSYSIIVGVLLITSCRAQSTKVRVQDKQHEGRLSRVNDRVFISRIKSLEMIKAREKTYGKLTYVVKDTPTTGYPYYIIQVGKPNKYRLEIFFNFYCYPETGSVRYYDTLKDSLFIPR